MLKKKFLFINISMLLLVGCAKKSDNTVNNVEEIVVTQEATKMNISENMDVYEKDSLVWSSSYVSDNHFYDQDELDFIQSDSSWHIKLSEAVFSEDPTEFGDYFSEIENDLYEAENWVMSTKECSREELGYLCVPVEITNTGDREAVICIGSLTLWKRIVDESLVEYGFSDMRLDSTGGSSELWYDYEDKIDGTKNYYYVAVQPNAAISTNILYLINKESLNENLYINLYWVNGEYDNKLECSMPPTDENVKYIKVNVKEEK